MDIEKKFFLSFTNHEKNDNKIKKSKLMNDIHNCGFLDDDPRLKGFKSKLNNDYETIDDLDYEKFKDCIDSNICILSKIFKRELIIPDFKLFTNKIKEIYDETIDFNEGSVASYIPQLARVDPNQYGISVCTIDGQRYNIGDTNVDFTVQSCC